MVSATMISRPTAERPIVGFIGLGDQGLPMAAAIADAGYELHVWARHPGSVTQLGRRPYVAHAESRELAEACDVVEICINTDADVLDLVGQWLVAGLQAGTVVVTHVTGTPGNARRLADMCRSRGVDALDAPVSGGRPAAEQRALTTLVGGPDGAVELCRPILETFSAHVLHLGDAGAGQTAKVLNNALQMMNHASIAEVVTLGSELGIDPVRLVGAIRLGSGSSRAMELLGTMITPATVDHLREMVDVDMDVFDAAMTEAGIDGRAVGDRGREGVDRLAWLAEQLTPVPAAANPAGVG